MVRDRRPNGIGRVSLVWGLAALSGCLAGLSSYVFLESLDWVTRTRLQHPWLLWTLPGVGVVVGVMYHRLGGRAVGGTGLVVREARSLQHGVPARMAPLILVGTLLGHLGGASVGREGTALQLSASLTDGAATRLGLDQRTRRVLLPAAVAGGFGAVFGVPVAGVVFAATVAAAGTPLVVVACVIAAFVGDAVVGWLGHDHVSWPQVASVDWSAALGLRLALLGVVCGVCARVFVAATAMVRRRVTTLTDRSWLRPVIGGLATLALVALVGRDHLGLSLPLIGDAFAGTGSSWTTPLLKMVFTAVALGTGFVGGEVTPLFVVGATTGAALAGVGTGVDAATVVLLVACGFVTVFAAAASATVAGIVMAVELFGWHGAVPAVIVGVVARIVAGRPGLYVRRGEIASRPVAAQSPNR